MQYISWALVAINVGFGTFIGLAPAGSIPWWVTAAVAALNAVVHAIPTPGINVTSRKHP